MTTKEEQIGRYWAAPKNDYEIAKLWSLLNENNYFIIVPSIAKYLEFKFIYPRLIVDIKHKTLQMDGAEVVGGPGELEISISDLDKLLQAHND